MRNFAIISTLLLGLGASIGTAEAQKAGSCKVCRDQHSACMKNYGGPACKTEYQMCLKSCKPG
ncbi:MAG: hypothetical protein PS018_13715 [bacterium]|nr:hypothetical protein [bacterium]